MHRYYTLSIYFHLTCFASCFVLPDIKIHTHVNLLELDTYIFDNLLFSTIFVCFILDIDLVKQLYLYSYIYLLCWSLVSLLWWSNVLLLLLLIWVFSSFLIWNLYILLSLPMSFSWNLKYIFKCRSSIKSFSKSSTKMFLFLSKAES